MPSRAPVDHPKSPVRSRVADQPSFCVQTQKTLVSSFEPLHPSCPAGARQGRIEVQFPYAYLPGARHAWQQDSSLLFLVVG